MKRTCGALLLALVVGCGSVEEEALPPPPDVDTSTLGTSIQGLEDDNGLTMNGLTITDWPSTGWPSMDWPSTG